jgi:RND family efflux transporter MFP subunit
MNGARSSRTVVIATLLSLVVTIGCTPPNEYQPPPPPPVTVAKPAQKTVTLYLIENGRTEAVERADVRAEVQGYLEAVHFTEGQSVAEGDLLYTIEQREYKAKRDSAKADWGLAEVAVRRATDEYERQDTLLKQNATSKSKWEQAKAERDGSIAARFGAKAQLDLAELDLERTEIKARIEGRITQTIIKKGNLVKSGDILSTVVQHDPIYAYFNISERFFLTLERQHPKVGDKVDIKTISAELQRDGDEGYPFKGNLDYVDQEGIDEDTGTLQIRAKFPNPESARQRILPGNFCRIRVPIGKMENALLVPEGAIARDQAGRYLMVVVDIKDDGEAPSTAAIKKGLKRVARRNITVGPKYGNMIVVETGLSADEQVIISGLQRAREDAIVNPKQSELDISDDELGIVEHKDDDPTKDVETSPNRDATNPAPTDNDAAASGDQ